MLDVARSRCTPPSRPGRRGRSRSAPQLRAGHRRTAARAGRGAGRADDRGDGQADRRGAGGGREVAPALRLLRRARPGLLADQPVDAGAAAQLGGATSRSASSWPSCRGTSRSGRCCASPRRRCWPATRRSSSTPRTSPAARWRSSRCSATPALPDDVFRTLVVAEADVPEVSRALIEDDRIAAVSLTGSERAGAAVAAARGPGDQEEPARARRLRPLRRPGRRRPRRRPSPGAVRSRFINTGQSCLAAKRFMVHGAVADEFSRRFAAAVAELRVGDPRDEATTIGPMARADLRDGLERQVRGVGRGRCHRARPAGARWTRPGCVLRADRARPTSPWTCRSWPRRRSGRSPR